MHNRLSIPAAKRRVKVVPEVLGEKITREGLAAILVYALQDLVCGGVAEAGKEREEAGGDGGVCSFAEDDLVELGS